MCDGKCIVEGCDRPKYHHKLWCGIHQGRFRNSKRLYIPEPIERVLPRTYVDGNGCWIYTGEQDKKGYGRAKVKGKHRFVTHIVYEFYYGPIQHGMFACHKCDNPSCVNPNHIFIGSQADNMRDMVAKGRNSKRHGELNYCSRLTEAQAIDILTKRLSIKEFSILYGVHYETVRHIQKGVIWKYLQEAKDAQVA